MRKKKKSVLYIKYIKRPFDFLIALFALILLSPLFIIISILIKFKLGSPIFFKQQRPGRNEQIFAMYKFRTMSQERDKYGKLLPDSVRLNKFGKFLRTTSLDELPELFNILIGDMSLVGPRPLLVEYLPYYRKNEKLRHTIRPGLSGLAQINGRNNLDWDSRLALDVQYVQHVNFIMDITIIFKTVIKAIKREDVTVIDKAPLRDLHIERKKEYENGSA